jgi:hypothetical protein
MSFELARADMVAAAQAAKAAWAGPPSPLVVSYENVTDLDIERQPSPYVCVDLHLLDSEQLSLGQVVTVADYGQIHIVAHVPENAGSLTARRILDHFRPYFELKTFTTLRTRTAMGAASYEKKGWYCLPLIVPFWYHRLVTQA